MRRAIRSIVLRCLFGEGLSTRSAELAEHLQVGLDHINRPLHRRFDRDLPGTSCRRARRARAEVDEIVQAEIRRRRAQGTEADDVLSWLVEAQDPEGGVGLSDEEVRDQVVSLFAAGYETTAAAMGWIAAEMASRPEIWALAREEVTTACPDGQLTVERLPELTYTGAIVSEALRLRSPATFSARRVVADVDMHGFTIPAGRMVLYHPWVTHRIPELWPDPETFEPGRWIPGDPAHHEVPPFAYVPFGGGSRRCLGFAFATQELVVMTALLARRVDAAPEFTPPLAASGVSAMAPTGGVPLTVTRIHPRAGAVPHP